MNLKNGYKTLYEVIEDSNRVFKASKTGLFEDAEEVATYPLGVFKAVYQEGNKLYGINGGGGKLHLKELDSIFIEMPNHVENNQEAPRNDEVAPSEPDMDAPAAQVPNQEGTEPLDGHEEEV